MQENDEEDSIIKSKLCDIVSYIRFVPRTNRKVDVFWINYAGTRVRYGTLDKSSLHTQFLIVDTFVSHPWAFCDSDTGDKLVVSGREIYFPKPYEGGGRSDIFVDIPVYTLKERCLQIVRELYTAEEIQSFLIPRTLHSDLLNREAIPFDEYMQFV